MNRVIKFRVWDQILKQYLQRCEIYDCYVDFHNQSDCSMNDLVFQQFTGLKDRNGREIYEGDIVESDDGMELISFKCGCFLIGDDKSFFDEVMSNHRNQAFGLEIIGNIFENPELLA